MSDWRGKVGALACSAIAALGCADIVSRAYLHRLDQRELRVFERGSGDTVDGFRMKRNFSQTWEHPEFKVGVHTNNIGVREDSDWNGQKIDIGVYGDSFAFGQGVEVGERFSDRLREHFPGKTVMSFGYRDGWAPPYYYLFAKRNPELLPKIGIVELFLGNDVDVDAQDTKLTFDAKGELIDASSRTTKVDAQGRWVNSDTSSVRRWLKRSALGELFLRRGGVLVEKLGLLPVPPEEVDIVPAGEVERGILRPAAWTDLGFLVEMKRLFESKKGRLIVLVVSPDYFVGDYPSFHDAARGWWRLLPGSRLKHWCPSCFDHSESTELRRTQLLPDLIMGWCRKNGLECIDPNARFQELEREGKRLYFQFDGHWTAAGHAAAAEILARHLAHS